MLQLAILDFQGFPATLGNSTRHGCNMTDDETPSVFTPRTLAERWECSERHVRKLIDKGDLPAFRLGGKLLRIRRETVESYELGDRGPGFQE